jgi:glycosyltransferase involved in cell wall biosynthesis
MRRIVHIANEAFDPPVSGADLRNFSVNSALEKCGDVKTIYAGHFCDDNNSTTTPVAKTVLRLSPDSIEKIIHQTIEHQPDIIVLAGVSMLEIASSIATDDALRGVKIISNCHNVESNLLEQIDSIRLPFFTRILAPLIFHRRWKLAENAEKRLLALVDQVWACSANDLALLERYNSSNCQLSVVPNVIPAWCQSRNSVPFAVTSLDRISAIFIGHLRYPPNKAAAIFLAKKVWRQVTKKWPDARLVIAGHSPHRMITKIANRQPDIDLLANPQTLSQVYKNANVSIMPLKQGGGTRIKVLEALWLGIPLIASKKAVEGINIENGIHFIEAETETDIVAALAKLKNDNVFLNKLVRNGQQFVSENHKQDQIDDLVKSAILPMQPR